MTPASRNLVTVAASWILLLLQLVWLAHTASAESSSSYKDVEIAYVIEPFESDSFQDEDELWGYRNSNEQQWNVSVSSTTTPDMALFGNSSLQIDFEPLPTTVSLNGTTFDLSWAHDWDEPPHNCYGARYLSFWYRVVSPGSSQVDKLRLTLFDDDYSSLNNEEDHYLKQFYHDIIMPDNNVQQDWQEVQIDLVNDLTYGDATTPVFNATTTTTKNEETSKPLNLQRIRGWQLEFTVTPNTPSATTRTTTTIFLDQLACIGGGEMLGGALHLGGNNYSSSSEDAWDQAIEQKIWAEMYYQSNRSESDSLIGLDDESGALNIGYNIQQVESWGGFISLQFTSPGNAYYNLTGALDLTFEYHIRESSSVPGRAHIRLMLAETSHYCGGGNNNTDCNAENEDFEYWYSFRYILDDPRGSTGQVVLPLEGSTDPESPFWLSGWAGSVGNRQFDLSHIKGFVIQLAVDSQGEMGSTVSGALDIQHLAVRGEKMEEEVDYSDEPMEISYVMEPFEWMNQNWLVRRDDEATLNLTILAQEGLVGNSSLLVGYEFSDPSSAHFGCFQFSAPHNCHGASHVSIWYRMVETPSPSDMTKFRLVLVDDNGNRSAAVLEEHYVDIPVASTTSLEWQNFRIGLEEFQSRNETGGNGKLDLHRLRGWQIELEGSSASGWIIFDQLSFVGGEELIGASFYPGEKSWDAAVAEGVWYSQFYQSPLSKNETDISLQDGILSMDYLVEQAESWGGQLGLDVVAPGPAYFNLSNANYLNLGYRTRDAASPPGRLHFRIILADDSELCSNCSDWERWYSFNYILDNNNTVGQIQTPLEGSPDPSSPFWQSGWSGVVGNRQFDKAYIKGFVLQLSLDSQGEMGSTVTGSIDLFDMAASKTKSFVVGGDELLNRTKFVEEPDLMFNTNSPRVRRREFLGNQCGETCASDATCLYALSTGWDCWTAAELEAGDVFIPNSSRQRKNNVAMWMDDAAKRGEFCDLCRCRESDQTIDCRNSDLRVVPKTFREEWRPKVLDLRNNSKLVVLGSGSLSEVADSLEELRVPKEMTLLSPGALDNMQMLSRIYKDDDGVYRTSNVLAEPTEAFSDICCSRGLNTGLVFPVHGLTFCEMEVKLPGSDSTLLPFVELKGATNIIALRPSSDFMSEAAESPEKCAEYCAISGDCKYFGYDARIQNAEHICYLQADNGTEAVDVCCEDDHYADGAKTLPGWTSGLPPRTRHEVGNAKVLIQRKGLTVDASTGYAAEYDLRLGTTPLRGAVWIEPSLATSTPMNVTFDPSRVVLYDSNSTATVKVTVSVTTLDRPDITFLTLLVHNKVTSCDVAFMESDDVIIAEKGTTVIIDVVLPQPETDSNTNSVIVTVIVALVVVLAMAVFVWFERKRKVNDALWKVEREELIFSEPPEILGRGSFGLCLKAEYRGTMVAVKRVIPPRPRTGTASGLSSSGNKFSIERPQHVSDGVSFGQRGPDSMASMQVKPSTSVANTSTVLRAQETKRRWSLLTGSGERALWKKRKDNFVSEMRYLSKLRHPCITTVMGAVTSSNSEPMLVMELMEHGSLFDLLHNETMILDGELILPILRDISQGMRFLHASNPVCVHGDLKSQNILVDKSFRAKVADFGLAQRKQGQAAGTYYWMSPELLRGESENTTASDVYAFGIILYEVYSRQEPYYGENMSDVLRLVADKTVSKRPGIPKHMPATVQSFMTDCLVDDPEQRPTFTELDQRLNRVDEKSLETSGTSRSKRNNNISLFDIFPKHVAEALRDGREVEAEHRDCVTIFFSDIVGFTDISSTLDPRKVAGMLDRLYSKMDELSTKYDVYKIETIGDAYMAVTNLVVDQPDDHAKRIAEFAVEAMATANTVEIDPDDVDRGCVQIRVGFHSGPVVADVVGTRNPRYCLFGDSVNTASRMESNGEKGRIHCSEASATLLESQCPKMPLSSRGEIDVKGKGRMETYWVNEEGVRPSDMLSSSAHSVHDVRYYKKSFRLNKGVLAIGASPERALSLAEEGQALSTRTMEI